MTQKQRLIKHLYAHGKITSLQAINLYGITRLSARIWELRHNEGMEITNRHVSGKNRYGEKINWDEYILVKP